MEKKLEAKVSEYKGNPIIAIPTGNSERYPFSFGYTKAKAILEYLDDIKKFVEEVEKTKEVKETNSETN